MRYIIDKRVGCIQVIDTHNIHDASLRRGDIDGVVWSRDGVYIDNISHYDGNSSHSPGWHVPAFLAKVAQRVADKLNKKEGVCMCDFYTPCAYHVGVEDKMIAFRSSIEEWSELCFDLDRALRDCQVCALFKSCVGCPISIKTGFRSCLNTPFYECECFYDSDLHDEGRNDYDLSCEETVMVVIKRVRMLKLLIEITKELER